jgi:hypothetical protein
MACGKQHKPSERITGLWVKIQAQKLLNSKQDFYSLAQDVHLPELLASPGLPLDHPEPKQTCGAIDGSSAGM